MGNKREIPSIPSVGILADSKTRPAVAPAFETKRTLLYVVIYFYWLRRTVFVRLWIIWGHELHNARFIFIKSEDFSAAPKAREREKPIPRPKQPGASKRPLGRASGAERSGNQQGNQSGNAFAPPTHLRARPNISCLVN